MNFANPENTNSEFKIINWVFYHQLVISTFSSLLCMSRSVSKILEEENDSAKELLRTLVVPEPAKSGLLARQGSLVGNRPSHIDPWLSEGTC